MRVIAAIGAFLLAGVLANTLAEAQMVKKGTVSGTVATQGVAIPASSSMPVFTAPAAGGGFFILTQACSSAQSVALSGSGLGPIAAPGGGCQTFIPGLALLPSEVLTCTNSSGSTQECTVTGVLSKR